MDIERVDRMYKKQSVSIILTLIIFSLVTVTNSMAWEWPWSKHKSAPVLVVINGHSYTTKDFEHWWNNWRDENTPFPKTPDEFINWNLLTQQAISMELYKDPEYRQKVLVFLKVRALLLLKYKTVDSKIHITDEQVKETYRTKYCPLWKVNILFIRSKQTAERIYKKLKAGKVSFATLKKMAKDKKSGLSFRVGWSRPVSCPPRWKKIIEKLKVGESGPPLPMGTGYIIINLAEKKGPSEADFKRVRGRIRYELHRQEENRLTNQLVNKLKKLYKVKVDWKLFEVISPGDVPKKLLNATLIQTSRGRVTVATFLKAIKHEMSYREQLHLSKQSLDVIKRRVLNDMIAQTITMWYALDQHYENKLPLKWVYRFYCQNRLIKELENRLFVPKVKVTSKDIEAFYKANIKKFTMPEEVKIAVMLPESKDLAEKIWHKISTGSDFFDVANQFYPNGVKVRVIPFNHLVPKMRKLINGLAIGEVSSPVLINKHWTIVKLMGRMPAKPIPLRKLRAKIYEHLWKQQFNKIKAAYIKKLRQRSKIIVHEQVWKQLVAELGTKNGNKKKAS